MKNKEFEKDLLSFYLELQGSDEEKDFLTQDFFEKVNDVVFVKQYIKEALYSESKSFCSSAVVLYECFPNKELLLEEFNQFLLNPYHDKHQELLLGLQTSRYESSIAYMDRALSQGFELFNTYSEDATVAKWYSHALACIGTVEAIEVLKKHSHSNNKAIAYEMSYRLAKL